MSDASTRRNVVRALGVFFAALTLWGTFRNVDRAAISGLLGDARGALALVLVPSCLAVVLECTSWREAFRLLGTDVGFWAIVRVRVASESVGSMLPLGAVFSETLKPALFARHAGLGASTSVAGIVARKYLLLTAHGLYIVLGFTFGYGALSGGFERVTGAAWLSSTVLVVALFVFGTAQAVLLGFRGGRVFEAIASWLARIPSRRLSVALGSVVQAARQSDREASAFFSASPRILARTVVPVLAAWIFEAVETWVMLRVLGARVSFRDVMGVEVLVGLGRQIFVFLPGGLGAQELGYAAFLSALGVNPETSAAFAVVKRGRDLAWIVAGLTLLVSKARHEDATVLTA